MSSIKKYLLGASVLFCALSAQADTTINKGKLTIGSDLTYPPYNFMVNNQAAGFDADFMQLLSHKLGLTPVVKDTRFASLINGLKSKKFDVIASTLYITPARAKQVNFIPYMKTGGSIMVKTASTWLPEVPDDLCGKKVGSIKGGAWIPKLEKVSATYCKKNNLGAIDVKEYPSSPETTQALISGVIDAQYEDAAVAKAVVEKMNQRLKISSKTMLYPVVVGLAISKDNLTLKADLEKAFKEVVDDGAYEKLLKKYNVQIPSAEETQKALAGTL